MNEERSFSTERRRYRRVKARVEVSIQKYNLGQNDFTTVEGTSKNLSIGGLLLHHGRPVELLSYVVVSFSLPGSDSLQAERMDFIGRVVRVEELIDGTYEIGIQFMRMILGKFENLMRYISSGVDLPSGE